MNIFYLDSSPSIAASMHCDQHLHKMILESAQMLSTAFFLKYPDDYNKHKQYFYKPTHQNHSCVQWIIKTPLAPNWTGTLAFELNQIRLNLGANSHAAMEIIDAALQFYFVSYIDDPIKDSGIFCGPAIFDLNNAQYPTVPLKYQAYYHHKAKQWALDGKPRMSYKNRPVPEFLRNSEWINHG